jgi:hypothetical protein
VNVFGRLYERFHVHQIALKIARYTRVNGHESVSVRESHPRYQIANKIAHNIERVNDPLTMSSALVIDRSEIAKTKGTHRFLLSSYISFAVSQIER